MRGSSSTPDLSAIDCPYLDLLPFLGIFAPDFRALLKAIATACLRFFNFFRPPDFSVPCLYSCITFLVFARPFVDDEDERLDEDRLLDDVFLAIIHPHSLDTSRRSIVSLRHESRRASI